MIIHAQSYDETISVSLSVVTTVARIRDHIMEVSGDLATVDVDLWDADGIFMTRTFLGTKESGNFDDMLNRISDFLFCHGTK